MELKKSVTKWLRSKKCVVVEIDDDTVVFFLEGFYGFLECKRSKSAPLRPGQKQFVDKMSEWSYEAIVYPGECWEKTKKELGEMLK